MGLPPFSRILLVSCFLIILISSGLISGKVMEVVKRGEYFDSIKESEGKSRKMIDVMDYADPGPNTNTRSGYLTPPPPSSTP